MEEQHGRCKTICIEKNLKLDMSLGAHQSKLRWRTPLQATEYVRAIPNSVKGGNNPKKFV
ncbi:MAG: hypothetical protein WCB90_04360 [Methanosarcina sp.]